MRNVNRTNKPQSLKNNAHRWTQELLAEIRRRRDVSKVSLTFFNKYQKEDIKESLINMYKGLCCYCESEIGVVEFGHIEHRMPKKIFPRNTYNWDNLHLSCTACNENKGNKYDRRYPILDAANDRITNHLTYLFDTGGIWRLPTSPRGKTTIDHAKLNRDGLNKNRNEIARSVLQIIREINSAPNPNNHTAQFRSSRLRSMIDGIQGSLIEYLIDNYMR